MHSEERMIGKVVGLGWSHIKSCQFEIKRSGSVHLDLRGIKDDRRWMLVDAHGQFLRMDTYPKMARIHSSMRNGFLLVSALGHGTHKIPLDIAEDLAGSQQVKIHRFSGAATIVGGHDQWFSSVLGVPCRLAVVDRGFRRTTKIQGDMGRESSLGFQDGYQVLVISEETHAFICEQLGRDVPIEVWRAGVIISGCGPFGEEALGSFSIGPVQLHGKKLCSRCDVPTVHPSRGTRDYVDVRDILRTMRIPHLPDDVRVRGGRERTKTPEFVGINADARGGMISVGDPVVLRSPFEGQFSEYALHGRVT